MSARKVVEAKRACSKRTRVWDVNLVATVEYVVGAEVIAGSLAEAMDLAADELRGKQLWWIQDEGSSPTLSVQAIDGKERA